MLAIISRAPALAMVASKSLARRRFRPSRASISTRGAGTGHYRIAAEGAEEVGFRAKSLDDRALGDHRTQRIAVADRLTQGDEVGYDVMHLDTPEMRAAAREADLHFVCDNEPTGSPHLLHDPREIALGDIWNAIAGEAAIDHEGGGI